MPYARLTATAPLTASSIVLMPMPPSLYWVAVWPSACLVTLVEMVNSCVVGCLVDRQQQKAQTCCVGREVVDCP
jgi:hypothetical protein